ncbi:heterokaryon incompatibility protein-domain-containing protein [Xylariaceae sp. FL0662B]|nr:heterokaryon incompatibility protein-domain-containing protein [Xylariaceae sp. FL0662B]
MIDASSLLIGTRWMWTRLIEKHHHYSSIEKLWRPSTHCALCQLLVRSLACKYPPAKNNAISSPRLSSYVVEVMETSEARAGSSLKMRLVVDGMEMPSLVVNQNISSATINWARDQINTCEKSHTQCRIPLAAAETRMRSQDADTRLIDLGQKNDPTLLLGRLAGIRLCKSNLETLIRPSRIDMWDKTYRDAIAITRMLGVRYLWIDALCIMQQEDGDDGAGLADWNKQAPLMGIIYAHAACVLSATAAKSTAGGCIFPKMPLGGGCHLREDEASSLDVNTARAKDTIVADLFREKVDNTPLSTRGWAFQERVLATRLLHFCDGVVLFECNEMQASSSHQMSQPYSHRQWLQKRKSILSRALDMLDPVAGAISIPWPKWNLGDFLWDGYSLAADRTSADNSYLADWDTFDASDTWGLTREPKTKEGTRAGLRAAFNNLVLSNPSDSANVLLHHFCWFELVGEYSSRCLTEAKDKITAIAGLAQYLPYHFKAGILFDERHTLTALNLLWVRLGFRQELEAGIIPPLPEHRAPTWSWASIDGCISHNLMPPSRSWRLYAPVVFITTYMKDGLEKLLLKLRHPSFTFDGANVHFIPDIQLEPGSNQNLQCVPLLYYGDSEKKKKPEIIMHGIVVRQAKVSVAEVTMARNTETGTEEEPTRELERVGYFSKTIKDTSWDTIESYGEGSVNVEEVEDLTNSSRMRSVARGQTVSEYKTLKE